MTIKTFTQKSFLMLKQMMIYGKQCYLAKTELERGLFFTLFFSAALIAFRIFYTGQWYFAWLLWNLFLALLPYLFTRTAIRRPQWVENRIAFLFLFAAWLFFLPNSFYIITDLFHLEDRKVVPLWYDLALLFSAAWSGILLGIASLRQMQTLLQCQWPQLTETQFLYPVMLLNALGVYIGRYLRYNSWDVLTNPFELAGDVAYLFVHPLRNRFDWSMIVCYTALLCLVYITVKRMSKALW